MFYVRRVTIPIAIIAFSTFFPDVNLILSLLGGSICGVCFIVLPVLFYRQAYIVKPSKKDRRFHICLGYLIVLITVPIGVIGVYFNLLKMMPTAGVPHQSAGEEVVTAPEVLDSAAVGA